MKRGGKGCERGQLRLASHAASTGGNEHAKAEKETFQRHAPPRQHSFAAHEEEEEDTVVGLLFVSRSQGVHLIDGWAGFVEDLRHVEAQELALVGVELAALAIRTRGGHVHEHVAVVVDGDVEVASADVPTTQTQASKSSQARRPQNISMRRHTARTQCARSAGPSTRHDM